MKIIQSMKARSSWLVLAMIALATSCIEEDIDNSISNSNEVAKVTIVMNLPSESDPSSTASTRALTETQENKISEIDILSFKKNSATDTWEYAYKSVGEAIEAVSGSTNEQQKKFTSSLVKDANNSQKLVLIANAHDIIDGLGITANEDMDELLGRIYSTMSTNWPITSDGEGSTPFPMYGITDAITINDATTSIPNVDMLRSIARIDVTLSDDVYSSQFKLQHVYVYKSNKTGNIVPGSTLPTIPSSVAKNGALEYSVGGSAVQNYEQEIYIHESANVGQASTAVTCIVVGGLYSTDGTETFYRLDFKDSDAAYIDIIRNHKYVFNITEVSGRGYSSADEAYENPSLGNIEAEIIDTGGVGDVLFNDDYYLSFAPSREVTFDYLEEASQTVTITTSFSKGFTIDKILGEDGSTPSWLSISESLNTLLGAGTDAVPLVITVDENTSGSVRVAYIYVTADRLSTKIKVTQGTLQDVNLYLFNSDDQEITSMVFSTATPIAQLLKVKWVPITSTVDIAKEDGTIAFPSGGTTNVPNDGDQITDQSGLKSYSILPTAITSAELTADPFITKSTQLTFSTSAGTNRVEKTISLTQLVPTIIVDYSNPYALDGLQHSFKVRSNTAWRIKTITPGTSPSPLLGGVTTDNLKVGTTGGYKTTTDGGDEIRFTTNTTAASTTTVTVVFQSIDPTRVCSDVSVVLEFRTSEYYPSAHGGWAGSNIYVKDGKLTFDDISTDGTVPPNCQHQGVFFTWGSLLYLDPSSTNWAGAVRVFDPRGLTIFTSTTSYYSWTEMIPTSDVILSNPPSDKSYYDRAYLYEIHNVAAGIGDICKYMTDTGLAPSSHKWRIPTGSEFGKAADSSNPMGEDYNQVGTWSNVVVPSENNDGTYNITQGVQRKNISTGYAYFPASGERIGNGGFNFIGTNVVYWSSSPGALGTGGYFVRFTASTGLAYITDQSRRIATPIRCVVDTDAEAAAK